MNNFPFGHNWCVSVSISFTSCNLQLSRYDTLIFCCTPSIIGKCPIFYFLFCGIIYFLQTFLNMPSIVHFSCQIQLKSIYAFSFFNFLFTYIWTSFFWHQSFLGRTIPPSIPISIGVCKQLWLAKGNCSYFTFISQCQPDICGFFCAWIDSSTSLSDPREGLGTAVV